ncbi:DEAD/DEAH box helicase [Methylomonas koyamae]|uniref:DEAD/DEAH box helicase n=1 Tax=Methylomonas koyamae TaxID=702114 RepID=UPI002873C290|nr:SNF2-related protein [Methylomonas koyamae]WNB74593.1 SNF2-related protein [Methylomonas koyamae]
MMQIKPGDRVKHAAFGQGVVISLADGYARVFFADGERQVPLPALEPVLGRNETVVTYAQGGEQRATKAWLCWKAHELPLLDSASSLTSAKIDLLPHQVVITHHVATSMPRRFLIADEVGLGKTIETALILRELASRGELGRALMVVPAGLVNNWHRELNEVFNLNFEIFGREGDVSDRRTNAFAKHNLLIASIDTLKRAERIKKLLDAPMWDLVVFDEAHHLTAYKQGNKIRKTQNYKLAEILRDHSRDLILLSATPHQGDHFRFWKLIQLLDPILFEDEVEMLEHRHRLNSVVIRRTKADACRADGSTLFARRWVHTEAFVMSDAERLFYQALNEYLRDGFALAKKMGGKGRALGFIMTIFQKIAASSFAAVHRTLRRRLLALTIHEGLMHDLNLDIEARDQAFREAKEIIRFDFGLSNERIDDLEVDRILSDAKLKVLKKLDEDELALASDEYSDEVETAAAEDMAMNVIAVALPEERQRIKELLQLFPESQETKVDKLIGALGVLWQQNPEERVVIFATYLGTVEMLGERIDAAYPGQGVVVLKGGDHGSKVAAEKRFKQANGPRVMICTAAGREGINLQHARILFNFDLPWNPMDVEQRIGRIHRYGQRDTAQVYNLVLGDTIEGRIYLLLDDKLKEIALTLGKVDERGNVAEDLRSQILGQLSERIKYQELYAEALQDPELRRTRLELDAAMRNACQARDVVFELFQDLDRFSLDDYAPLSKVGESMELLVDFIIKACVFDGYKFARVDEVHYELRDDKNQLLTQFTVDRNEANESEHLHLVGLDHPFIEKLLSRYRQLPAEDIGIAVKADGVNGVLSIWQIQTHNDKGHDVHSILKLAVDRDGNRLPMLEKHAEAYFQQQPIDASENNLPLLPKLEMVVERELKFRGIVKEGQPYSAGLIGWLDIF